MRQFITISYIYINSQKATKIRFDKFVTELFQTFKWKAKNNRYKVGISKKSCVICIDIFTLQRLYCNPCSLNRYIDPNRCTVTGPRQLSERKKEKELDRDKIVKTLPVWLNTYWNTLPILKTVRSWFPTACSIIQMGSADIGGKTGAPVIRHD